MLTHVSACFAMYEEVHTSYMLTIKEINKRLCCASVCLWTIEKMRKDGRLDAVLIPLLEQVAWA